MVFTFAKRISENVQRRIRRALLAEPEKTPQRIAIAMASIVLLSIVITYNVLFEREKQKQGIQPPTAMDLYRQRNAKEKLERLELQRNILQIYRNTNTSTTGKDL
ncbi:unnamed protein product [Adineta ricciae]|uniref:Uncharacterized protein n=1 Tax=Adineta ricciae TaxID=249248 RepID=A0A813RFX4_ADIRI|nr:unnamed protein product [Adineta ricciae]